MESEELESFHGPSAATARLLGQIERHAKLSLALLIQGARGTGKSRAARAIVRRADPDGSRSVLEIDFSAEPAALPDAASFGETDSFLLLENVGAASSKQQDRLWAWLRSLDRERGRKVLRQIATCEGSLGKLVALRRFRSDLYLRLRVTTIEMPTLEERAEDIPHLLREFLQEFARESREESKTLTAEAVDWALSFPWPGNVSQLRQELLRAAAANASPVIGRENLQPDLEVCADPIEGLCVRESAPLHERVKEFERSEVLRILEDAGGVRERAAEILGIDRRTLQRKLRHWQTHRPRAITPQKVF